MAQQPDHMNEPKGEPDDPQEVRRQITQTRQDMGRTMAEIEDRVHPQRIKERQVDKVRQRWRGAREAVMGSPGGGPSRRDRAGDYASGAKDTVQQTPERAVQATRGNPLAAGAIAFGVGALAGTLLPPSDAERRAAGRLRDEFEEPVRDELQRSGQRIGEAVQQRAREAGDEVKQTAEQAAGKVKQDAQEVSEERPSRGGDVSGDVSGDAPARPDAPLHRRPSSPGDVRP